MELLELFEDEFRSVSQYTAEIKRLLEGRIPPSWIIGEVSNLRMQASGHIYFSLKDAGAQLPAVMFRGDAARLDFALEDGMEVLAFGQLSVYEPHGRYQLVARALKESGKGRLYREFERLKRKLSDEGLFAPERKRPLPALPLRVAIITSPSGAALQDFTRILKRRGWGGRLRVIPAAVQGKSAAGQVVEAIDFAVRSGDFDLLVVARGGGSIEDLWCFNEEAVARAVANCPIPTISAVGHEIDFTLCDFAADVRAETPSGAAELISSSYLQVVERLAKATVALAELATQRLTTFRSAVQVLGLRLRAESPVAALERNFMRTDDLATRLDAVWMARLRENRDRLEQLSRRFERAGVEKRLQLALDQWRLLSTRLERRGERALDQQASRLERARIRLESLSPQGALRRGYALLQSSDGGLVTSVDGVQAGELLVAQLKDGRLALRTEKVESRSSS